MSEASVPTDSLVERFGLFVIIVLGEVIFGVVGGMSAAEIDMKTITTGSLALIVGFGIWWLYFDLVGRRLPRRDRGTISTWMLSHVPITGAIVAVGPAWSA
jgi:low temperature requirement protein LtrA